MRNIYIGSDNLISLGPLTNSVTGAAVTTATVTAVIKLQGVTVGSTITLAHVSGGLYRGNIDDSTALLPGSQYHLEITSNDSGTVLFKKIPFVAIYDSE